ncbi:YdiU family protein [Gracilibacillus caseinilyticus]|uniref:Protein nucleotidyltransferase YdiU n=1 Tax=Gracilibacillus caseinilyticus TaxID=2932256 RepID=A0ABY4EWV8_9BACI|nr:YdiU family protein [Gracilibacillus caseinilyticus]UOQ48908.1 YdiU family protein [Gracilibacillus caseinilyticus]
MTAQQNEGWKLDNSYQRLPGIFYARVQPTPVKAPDIVKLNKTLAKEIGLDPEQLKGAADLFGGNRVPAGGMPIAQAYAGHQFANFTMLGDGRAVLLGEQITPVGKRVDIQLKGSGKTPFSRGGDGRAVLAPMLREYLISEAMHGLQIPTNRSLAVVTTGENVQREIEFPGAVLTRVADSHLRVGTFQYARHWGTKEDLQVLADYAIDRHYPDLKEADNRYLALLKEVVKKQAALVAKWQLIGFIHGVMNTDNVTISGQTIDYGPCAFMDQFDRSTVFSSIDVQGRYAYGNQPDITGWNLARFAESLLLLIDENEEAALETVKDVMHSYIDVYEEHWLNGMRQKLGLTESQTADKDLIARLLDLMEQHQADYTNTFRSLTLGVFDEKQKLFQSNAFKQWYQQWKERLATEQAPKSDVQQLMKANNPSIIPRNYLVEEALDSAAKGEFELFDALLQVLADPFAYSKEQEPYAVLPPEPDQPFQTFCGT